MSGTTRRTIASHALAAVGMSLPWPLLVLLVWEQTGDGWAVGLAGAARMLPYVALSWAAGRLADRFARDRIVRLTLVARTLSLLAVAAALASGQTWLALGAATVAIAVATPAYPALAAAMPGLRGRAHRARDQPLGDLRGGVLRGRPGVGRAAADAGHPRPGAVGRRAVRRRRLAALRGRPAAGAGSRRGPDARDRGSGGAAELVGAAGCRGRRRRRQRRSRERGPGPAAVGRGLDAGRGDGVRDRHRRPRLRRPGRTRPRASRRPVAAGRPRLAGRARRGCGSRGPRAHAVGRRTPPGDRRRVGGPAGDRRHCPRAACRARPPAGERARADRHGDGGRRAARRAGRADPGGCTRTRGRSCCSQRAGAWRPCCWYGARSRWPPNRSRQPQPAAA